MIRKIVLVTLLITAVFITSMIFHNSLKSSYESYKDSDSVAQIVKPIVPEEVAENEKTLDHFVRKGAHAVEFFALGAVITSLVIFIKVYYRKFFAGTGAFFIAAVAVSDEFIQSFTGRTSSVEDIVIDFIGGSVGAVAVLLLFALCCFVRIQILKSHRLGGKEYEKNQGGKNQP